MNAIRIDTAYLDLFPDTDITFKEVNPAFAKDLGYHGHSFKFNAPDTPHNRASLGFPDAFLATPAARTVEAVHYYDGAKRHKGILTIHDVKPGENISLSFATGADAVADQLRAVRLTQLDLGGTRTATSGLTASAILEVNQTVALPSTVAITVNGSLYSTSWDSGDSAFDVLSEIELLINNDTALPVSALASAGSPPLLTLTADAAGPGSPLTINVIPSQMAHTWTVNGYTSSDHISMLAVTNHMQTVAAATIGTYPYTFCPVYNTGFYLDKNSSYKNYLNLYDPVAGSFVQNAAGGGTFGQNTAVPFVQIKYILDQLLTHIGYTDISTFTDTADFKKLHFYNNVSLDREGPEGDGTTSVSPVNWFTHTFDLTNHVPDLTGLELLQELSKLMNLAVEFDIDKKTVNFFKKADIFGTTEVNWVGKTLQPYRIKYINRKGFTYSFEKDDNDVAFAEYSYQLGTATHGDGSQKVNSPLTPLTQEVENDPTNSESWQIPTIKGPASTTYKEMGTNDFGTRIFFYHGMQPNNAANNFPSAGYSRQIGTGPLLADHTLKWEGTDGLYESFYKPFEDVIDDAREGTFAMDLNLLDLQTIDWAKRYRFRVLEGEVVGILREVQYTLSNSNGISVSQVNMIKI